MSVAEVVPPAPPNRSLLHTYSPIYLGPFCRTLKQGLQIHAQIILRGLRHHRKLHLYKLLSFFALSGSPAGLQHSLLLFSKIPNPDAFVYNTLISGQSRSGGSLDTAAAIYRFMVSDGGVSPNSVTFLFLLDSCSRFGSIELGRQLHSRIIKNEKKLEMEGFVGNSLIHMYHCLGDCNSARQVFDRSPRLDVVSFNVMVNGYAKQGRGVDAMEVFAEMLASGVTPDEHTFVHLLSASLLLGPRTGKLIHQMICKSVDFIGSDIVLTNALVDMYAKFGLMVMADRVFRVISAFKSNLAWTSMISGYASCGEIDVARSLFDNMPKKDLVSWTAMIGGYSRVGKYKEALELFNEMEKAGVEADEVTIVTVLSACAQLGKGALDYGKKLHKYIKRRTSVSGQNHLLMAAFVDMYAKCGCISTALDIFYGVEEELKSVSLFNSMISGLARHGLGAKAVMVFRCMESSGLKPDEITFVGVLHACAYSGLIDEGKGIFASMIEKYGVKPRVEHYGCMVNLLSRRGLLQEAFDLAKKIPFSPSPIIWVTLLNACMVHGNAKMGKLIGSRLLELEPNKEERPQFLSSLFANDNHRWKEAKEMRQLLDYKYKSKPKGTSYR